MGWKLNRRVKFFKADGAYNAMLDAGFWMLDARRALREYVGNVGKSSYQAAFFRCNLDCSMRASISALTLSIARCSG